MFSPRNIQYITHSQQNVIIDVEKHYVPIVLSSLIVRLC